MNRVLASILRYVAVAPLLLILTGWAGLALWFDGPQNRTVAAILALVPPVGALASLLFLRPLRRAALVSLTMFLAVFLWWSSIAPSNDRDWQSDVARPPRVEFDGSRVTIHNVRNFDYRSETDFTERWETRTFDLDQLTGVDFFLSYWGSPLIAHTIVSWEFADGQHLAVSIETRKEKGESYSAVRGFFRQYELYYVVADERDVIRVRTNYRGEQVYLYRLKVMLPRVRAILVDYLEEINRLAERPRWYNAFSHNCTTSIRKHAMNVAPGNPWNWRILVNGRLDELGYMRGTIDNGRPFEEVRRRSNVTERAQAADRDPTFSARIRDGVVGIPVAGARSASVLAGTSWTLATLGGRDPLPDTTLTLRFAADGKASGSDGCNSFAGSFHEEGKEIGFARDFVTTMMACPEPVTNQAAAYTQALQRTAGFAIDANRLALRDAGGTELASFTARAEGLAGTSWDVIAYNNGKQGVVSVVLDTEITATFGSDGRVQGSAGCNNYFASYRTDGADITVGAAGTTRKFCGAPDGAMDQERQYLEALQSAATYRVDGDRMELRRGDGALAVTLQKRAG